MRSEQLITPRRGLSLYEQARLAIEGLMRSEQLKPGDRLPSERELCEMYGLSSITVRRALLELEKSGAINRHGGLGTFVAENKRALRLLTLFVGYDDRTWHGLSGIQVGPLIGGICQAAWERLALVSVVNVPATTQLRSFLAPIVADRLFDGVILRLAVEIEEEDLDFLESKRFPYVVVRRRLPGREMSCVVEDWEGCAAEATNHLLALNHRRIGVLLGPRTTYMFRAMETGYSAALAAAGVETEPGIVRSGLDFSLEQGYAMTSALCTSDSPPDALFATTATLCAGTYRALRDLKLRIPEDVAVVGWDMQGLLGETVSPPLTAITASVHTMGLRSAELLLDMVEQGHLLLQTITVPASLVVRESCGASVALARTEQPRRQAQSEQARGS